MRKKITFNDYANDYASVINDYSLRGLSKQDQSNKMIDIAESIQHQICNESDAIKFDGVKTASSILGHNLKRSDWCEMVNYGVRSNNANTDKLYTKLDDEITNKALVNNINNSIKSIVNSGSPVTSLQIPVDNSSYTFVPKTVTYSDLDNLYTDCVDKRTHINKVLYKEYNRISRAFQYLYEGKLNHNDFKILVDDQVYANGGYPSPTTPPRTWSRINKFRELIDAMIAAGKSEYITEYLAKFGIEVKLTDNSFSNGWVQHD